MLASIYMCNITRWNDPLIASLNPGARWASRTLWFTNETPAVTCLAVLVTQNAAGCRMPSSGGNNGRLGQGVAPTRADGALADSMA